MSLEKENFPTFQLEALSEIVEAVGHRTVIMMDGGIRQGTDVFKAIALGAKLVSLTLKSGNFI